MKNPMLVFDVVLLGVCVWCSFCAGNASLLAGGSDALVLVTAVDDSVRWGTLGILGAALGIARMRRSRCGCASTRVLLSVWIAAGWTVALVPRYHAVEVSLGGVVVQRVPLHTTNDGLCVDSFVDGFWVWEVNSQRIMHRLLPLPTMDRLSSFLASSMCHAE